MRKNKSLGARGLIYSVFEVKGYNLDGLVNYSRRKGVNFYGIEKIGKNAVRVTLKSQDADKFFAIAEDLCYNIRKIRDKGALRPIYSLLKNFGLAIGAAVFFVVAALTDDVIFAFSFDGSGSVYGREVAEYLSGRGITAYTRFSSLDMRALGGDILASNPHLSYAGCKKRGNRLVIELALSSDKAARLSGKEKSLLSDCDGVVESVKVYRGTAEVSIGDAVKKGDVLVAGYAVVKENRVDVNVLACVSLRAEFIYEYRSEKDGREETALVVAEQAAEDKEIISSSVEKTFTGGEYAYRVTVIYRRTLYAG